MAWSLQVRTGPGQKGNTSHLHPTPDSPTTLLTFCCLPTGSAQAPRSPQLSVAQTRWECFQMQHLGKHKGVERKSPDFLYELKSFLVIDWPVQPMGQLQLHVDFSPKAALILWHKVFFQVMYVHRGVEGKSNNMKRNLEICWHYFTFPPAV